MKYLIIILFLSSSALSVAQEKSGNPLFPGWYADPEGLIIGDEYWVYPTYSAAFEEQVFLDAFSSPDLMHWKKHSRILDTNRVDWAIKAMWAPAMVEKEGKYYLFFASNNPQHPESPYWNPTDTATFFGGIGVAIANHPGGPFQDYLGKPLISEFHNGAQPIDQFVFQDQDGSYYMLYGGWGHCNIARLNDDFTGFTPFPDGQVFKEITPENYVEGSFMFVRNDKYYFMWSEGSWGGPDYSVAYAIADSPLGPFKRIAKVLQQDPEIATGAGHHSVVQIPGRDEWYIFYHRRPAGETARDYRVTCIERMYFDEKGFIKPIKITKSGVAKRSLK